MYVFSGQLGFVLVGYDKRHRHGSECRGEVLCSQIPKNRRHSMTHRATQRSTGVSQEAEMGKMWAQAFSSVFHGKEWVKQGQQAQDWLV